MVASKKPPIVAVQSSRTHKCRGKIDSSTTSPALPSVLVTPFFHVTSLRALIAPSMPACPAAFPVLPIIKCDKGLFTFLRTKKIQPIRVQWPSVRKCSATSAHKLFWQSIFSGWISAGKEIDGESWVQMARRIRSASVFHRIPFVTNIISQ